MLALSKLIQTTLAILGIKQYIIINNTTPSNFKLQIYFHNHHRKVLNFSMWSASTGWIFLTNFHSDMFPNLNGQNEIRKAL